MSKSEFNAEKFGGEIAESLARCLEEGRLNELDITMESGKSGKAIPDAPKKVGSDNKDDL